MNFLHQLHRICTLFPKLFQKAAPRHPSLSKRCFLWGLAAFRASTAPLHSFKAVHVLLVNFYPSLFSSHRRPQHTHLLALTACWFGLVFICLPTSLDFSLWWPPLGEWQLNPTCLSSPLCSKETKQNLVLFLGLPTPLPASYNLLCSNHPVSLTREEWQCWLVGKAGPLCTSYLLDSLVLSLHKRHRNLATTHYSADRQWGFGKFKNLHVKGHWGSEESYSSAMLMYSRAGKQESELNSPFPTP